MPRAYELFNLPGSSYGGGWMVSLAEVLAAQLNISLCIATAAAVKSIQTRHERNITYVLIPGGGRRSLAWQNTHGVQAAVDVINATNPDLVHIHGTENFYGLITRHPAVTCPVVISLQGLMGPYTHWYAYFGDYSPWRVFCMISFAELLTGRGLYGQYHRFLGMARRELRILEATQYVMGRTRWDKAYACSMNPSVIYYHVGEIMRTTFWRTSWDIARCRRNTIFFSNAGAPRKGTELLLDALSLVQREVPDATLCIAGEISARSGYGRHLHRRIAASDGAVRLLGVLTADEMVQALCQAHVFVSPSYIDNSPNVVCEAQVLGLPVIATYCGGLSSLITDGETGLFAPTGDVPMIAARILEVFRSDTLAVALGQHALQEARRRHAPDRVYMQLRQAYDDILTRNAQQNNVHNER